MKKIFTLIIFTLIITRNQGQTNGCFYNLTPNTYTISPHGLAHSIASGDFNNDGLLDLAVAASNRINIFIGDGT
ncbi:MAG: FG-GAP repeat protein, partial [Sphingobacteriaceae bacterium]